MLRINPASLIGSAGTLALRPHVLLVDIPGQTKAWMASLYKDLCRQSADNMAVER
jgi:hypothetical protein